MSRRSVLLSGKGRPLTAPHQKLNNLFSLPANCLSGVKRMRNKRVLAAVPHGWGLGG